MAETEEAHRAAFNEAFEEAGLSWRWSEGAYRELLTTTGGRERIARYMDEEGIAPDDKRVATLHIRKNGIYGDLVTNGAVMPRPGVVDLIEAARRHGISLAIATTTSRVNLSALLVQAFGTEAPDWFATIVSGEDVSRKKPDPEAYLRALAALVLDPSDCVAIEDSRNGLDAALAAGLATVVTPSIYTAHERFSGAGLVVPDLVAVDLETLGALLA